MKNEKARVNYFGGVSPPSPKGRAEREQRKGTTVLDQIFGSIFMCLVMALAISLRKKGKRKYALITVGSFLTLLVALTCYRLLWR